MSNVKDEALKLAIEALTDAEIPYGWDFERIIRTCELALEQKEQEPSAYGDLFSYLRINRFLTLSSEVAKAFPKNNYKLTPLYTSPQLKTYVPLTDDEIETLTDVYAVKKEVLNNIQRAKAIEQAVLAKLGVK